MGLDRESTDERTYIDVPYMGDGTVESSRATSVCQTPAKSASNSVNLEHKITRQVEFNTPQVHVHYT